MDLIAGTVISSCKIKTKLFNPGLFEIWTRAFDLNNVFAEAGYKGLIIKSKYIVCFFSF